MAEVKETNIDIINVESLATVSSSERKYINKILKLHESRPEEVNIIVEPEDNYGVIVAKMPKSYIKISPPRKVSEEQKAAASERMKAMHESKGD